MKYSLHWNRNSKYMDFADEIIINYSERDPNLIKFVLNRPAEQQIVVNVALNISFNDNIEIFKAAAAAHQNIKFMIHHTEELAPFISADLWVFSDAHINNWQDLVYWIGQGVHDVYITDELGFDIKEVANYCHNSNVNVRVYPNIGQDRGHNLIDIVKFFILPHMMKDYEGYIDYCEFWGPIERQDVVYEIYKGGKWAGRINQLILEVPSLTCLADTIYPELGEMRMKCCKKCLKNKCSACNAARMLGNQLTTANVVFEK